MYQMLNTNIRCSSKIIFLIALNNEDKPFDALVDYKPYKKLELWIGAVDNSIVPFKSTGSFTDDVAMFFSICANAYESNYYRITYNENKLQESNFNVLKYQYEGIEQIYSKFNYMYHTTLFCNDKQENKLFSKKWFENSFKDVTIDFSVFDSERTLHLYDVFDSKYFEKTLSELNADMVFGIDNLGMLKYSGINNNGQLCYVTVPPADEFISPLYFEKQMIDVFQKNKIFDFRILNIGLLFNSPYTHTDFKSEDAYSSQKIIKNLRIFKDGAELKKKMFNYDCFRTQIEVAKKNEEGKLSHRDKKSYDIVTVNIIPQGNYIPEYHKDSDEDEVYTFKDYKDSIYKERIDYIELYNNNKSLYKAPKSTDTQTELNSDLPEANLDYTQLGKKAFIVSSYDEDERKKYIKNTSSYIVDTHSTFFDILDENGNYSIENSNVYIYSLDLPQSLLYDFSIKNGKYYNKIAPLMADYVSSEVITDTVASDESWKEISPMSEYAILPLFKDKVYGCWKVEADNDLKCLVVKIKMNIDAICDTMYTPSQAAIKKLYLYSENWLLSDMLQFLDAYTDFTPSKMNFINIKNEYNLMSGIPQGECVLDEDGNLYVHTYKRTTSYEERGEYITTLDYAVYDIDGEIKPLLNMLIKKNVVIEPAESTMKNVLDNIKCAYLVPYNHFSKDITPAADRGDKFTNEMFGGHELDIEYFNNIYKEEKDIYKTIDGDTLILDWQVYTKL